MVRDNIEDVCSISGVHRKSLAEAASQNGGQIKHAGIEVNRHYQDYGQLVIKRERPGKSLGTTGWIRVHIKNETVEKEIGDTVR